MRRSSWLAPAAFASAGLVPATTALAQCDAQWILVSESGPSARQGPAMAYDSARKCIVLFGGANLQGRPGDTWEWDGGRWRLIPTTSGPAGREGTAMTFDAARSVTVLFGGSVASDCGNGARGETWEWNAQAWSRRADADSLPGRRFDAGIAYDPLRNRCVAFGGVRGCTLAPPDTYEWDGTSWSLAASGGTPVRTQFGLAFDPTRQRVVMFGGGSNNGMNYVDLNDLREWSGSQWTLMTPSGILPAPRGSVGFTGVPNGLLLFGGTTVYGSPSALFADTWLFSDNYWTRVSDAGPAARNAPGMAYNADRDEVVLFGGRLAGPGANFSNQTWIWSSRPVLPQHPDDLLICPSNSAVFTVTAAGAETGGTYAFQWQVQDRDIPTLWHDLLEGENPSDNGSGGTFTASGVAGTSLTLFGFRDDPSDLPLVPSLKVRCLVSNACGLTQSLPATLHLCAPDFNCDATADFFDYLDFVAAFANEDPAADFNGDNIIDFFDYLDFVAAFDAGCE